MGRVADQMKRFVYNRSCRLDDDCPAAAGWADRMAMPRAAELPTGNPQPQFLVHFFGLARAKTNRQVDDRLTGLCGFLDLRRLPLGLSREHYSGAPRTPNPSPIFPTPIGVWPDGVLCVLQMRHLHVSSEQLEGRLMKVFVGFDLRGKQHATLLISLRGNS